MGYIEDLRSLVGNRPLILNSALVIFKNEKERFYWFSEMTLIIGVLLADTWN